jgi:hypothetical protein
MYKNFTLQQTQDLPEMKGTGHLYTHTSGARILHVQNADNDKVFNVIFRTPPGDDTGVPHILEHCVLNGSQKYPIKDPFFTLAKGSLVTFLNAMTYKDITMYPVASYNQKDFLNLMGVYLDAVYKPLVHERDLSFLQEGWHYVLENAEDDLTINGVVYSEMKGAFSDPEAVLYLAMCRQLYPGCHYRFDSGGAPEAIPNLTYEQFKDFHKTLYNPANSYIYLYGDMEIGPCFELLDTYLSDAEDRTAEIRKIVEELPRQQPFAASVTGSAEYSINETDDPHGKNFLGAAYAAQGFPDPLTFHGIHALEYILLETPASPLKNALLEKKIGESVSNGYGVPSSTPAFDIFVKNSAYDVSELKNCIEAVIGGIVKNGLDKKYVDSCLNYLEFTHREKEGYAPKGLSAILREGCGWTYGANPMDYFAPVKAIETIREKIANGEPYFENLAKTLFLDNPFSSFVTLKAKPGLQGENEAKLKESLALRKAALSEEEINHIITQKARLDKWQETADTPEGLATVPILNLSDIDKKAKFVSVENRDLGEAKALFAPISTDGIVYNNFMFDVRVLDGDEIPAVGILLTLLAKLDTKKRGFGELVSEINGLLGGWDCGFSIFFNRDSVTYRPVFDVSVKALEKNNPAVYALTREILTETCFNDKDRVRMLLAEKKAQLESEFIQNGMRYAGIRAYSYLDERNMYSDKIRGYGFYEYLKKLMENFDGAFDGFINQMETLCRKLFNREALQTAVASGEGAYNAAAAPANELYAALSGGKQLHRTQFAQAVTNEAFIIESAVNYNATAFNLAAHGRAYDSKVHVLRNIIDLQYLLEELRVKGGAYGFSCNIRPDGFGALLSYQDPNLERTYKVYRELPDFIEKFTPSQREMTQFILGSVNELDKPLTPGRQFASALTQHYEGLTPEKMQAERDALLATTAEEIRAFVPLLRKCANGPVCTFGSESAVRENEGMFNRVVKV